MNQKIKPSRKFRTSVSLGKRAKRGLIHLTLAGHGIRLAFCFAQAGIFTFGNSCVEISGRPIPVKRIPGVLRGAMNLDIQ